MLPSGYTVLQTECNKTVIILLYQLISIDMQIIQLQSSCEPIF